MGGTRRGEEERRARLASLVARVAATGAGALPRPLLRPLAPASRIAGWRSAIAAQWAVEVEQRRLVLWCPALFGLGILLYFGADAEPSRWAPALAGVACAAGAVARRRRADAAFRGLVALAALFAGFTAAGWRSDRVAAPVLDRPRSAALTAVVEAVEVRPGSGRLLLRPLAIEGLAPAQVPFRIRVTVPNRPTVQAGDVIAAQARLMPPPEPSRPHGYDFAREAFFAGLGAVGSLNGRVALVPQPPPPGWGLALAAAVDRARNGLTRRIAEAIGGPAGAVAASLVTGKRGLIPDATNDDLRAAGIYHVVSISGLHMVLAAGMVFWAVRALLALWPAAALRLPIKKIAATIAILAAFAYNVFAGSEVATERSLVMTVVLLGAILVDRPALSMRNLALAALVVLAMEPESLLGPSFQMSFAAVAALIAVFERPGHGAPEPEGLGLSGLGTPPGPAAPPPSGPVLRHLLALRRHLLLALLTTLVAEAATAPFALYHFQRISPFGLAGNLLTLPLVSFVVMPAAVVGVVAMPFGWDAGVWWIMGLGVEGMLRISAAVASWPGAGGAFRGFGVPVLLLLSLAILCATLWRSALRWTALPVAGLAVAVAAREPPAAILVTPDGQAVLARGADGRMGVVGRRPSSFTLEQWLRSDGDTRSGEDRSLFAGRCDPDGCVAALAGGGTVAQVLRAQAFEEDCRRAVVVVTPLKAPPFCRPPVLIDRERLAGTGAVALLPGGRDEAGVATYDVMGQRRPTTDRPWVRKPRTAPTATPAQAAGEVTPAATSTASHAPADGGTPARRGSPAATTGGGERRDAANPPAQTRSEKATRKDRTRDRLRESDEGPGSARTRTPADRDAVDEDPGPDAEAAAPAWTEPLR